MEATIQEINESVRQEAVFVQDLLAEIRKVIVDGESAPLPYTGEGTLVDSGLFSGLDSVSARNSVTEWLDSRGAGKKKVTYHTPCHLGRGLKTTAEPYLRELLGAYFVPLEDTDVCCGFAGSYSVDFPGISSGILNKKVEQIKESGADIVVTDCPGCVMQIEGGVLTNNLPLQVMHVSDYLATLEIIA